MSLKDLKRILLRRVIKQGIKYTEAPLSLRHLNNEEVQDAFDRGELVYGPEEEHILATTELFKRQLTIQLDTNGTGDGPSYNPTEFEGYFYTRLIDISNVSVLLDIYQEPEKYTFLGDRESVCLTADIRDRHFKNIGKLLNKLRQDQVQLSAILDIDLKHFTGRGRVVVPKVHDIGITLAEYYEREAKRAAEYYLEVAKEQALLKQALEHVIQAHQKQEGASLDIETLYYVDLKAPLWVNEKDNVKYALLIYKTNGYLRKYLDFLLNQNQEFL